MSVHTELWSSLPRLAEIFSMNQYAKTSNALARCLMDEITNIFLGNFCSAFTLRYVHNPQRYNSTKNEIFPRSMECIRVDNIVYGLGDSRLHRTPNCVDQSDHSRVP